LLSSSCISARPTFPNPNKASLKCILLSGAVKQGVSL
jgi:hypothetical protein